MRDKDSFWKALRKTWQIWIVVVSFLLGLGIIQIDFIKLTVPESWKVYIVFSSVLIGLISTIFVLIYENKKLIKQIGKLESNNSSPFMLLVEGIPIYALTSHIAKRKSNKPRNPVYLDLLTLYINVYGKERIKDATLIWRFKGKNASNNNLSGFFMSIASENAIPFSELQCQVYDLASDGSKQEHRLPRFVADDSNHKDLQLPFQAPGILPYGPFDIEFTYTWPSIVNPKKDYWFVEPRAYGNEVNKFVFVIDYPASSVKAAMIFEISIEDKNVTFIGSLQIIQGTIDHFQYETEKVTVGKVYMIIVETND